MQKKIIALAVAGLVSSVAALAADLAAILALEHIDRHRIDDAVRAVLAIDVGSGVVLTTEGGGTVVVGQADEGLANREIDGGRRVAIRILAVFHREDGLEAVAQRFFALETETAAAQAAVLDAAELVRAADTVVAAAVGVALVDHAIDGHVRLRKGNARNQTGNCQCDDFLLHCESPLGC